MAITKDQEKVILPEMWTAVNNVRNNLIAAKGQIARMEEALTALPLKAKYAECIAKTMTYENSVNVNEQVAYQDTIDLINTFGALKLGATSAKLKLETETEF